MNNLDDPMCPLDTVTPPTEADVVRAFNVAPPLYKPPPHLAETQRERHAPTTSDPVRQFDEAEKEKDMIKLMSKIACSKFYTITEYREIEARIRKLANLPRRDYLKYEVNRI